mmetsp:Transcript_50132/g.109669  ORF Transcript_50132/g.109669 Transcript_50132/m.109669 type:complete len:223 (-) Transcript_50132:6-674(-)
MLTSEPMSPATLSLWELGCPSTSESSHSSASSSGSSSASRSRKAFRLRDFNTFWCLALDFFTRLGSCLLGLRRKLRGFTVVPKAEAGGETLSGVDCAGRCLLGDGVALNSPAFDDPFVGDTGAPVGTARAPVAPAGGQAEPDSARIQDWRSLAPWARTAGLAFLRAATSAGPTLDFRRISRVTGTSVSWEHAANTALSPGTAKSKVATWTNGSAMAEGRGKL